MEDAHITIIDILDISCVKMKETLNIIIPVHIILALFGKLQNQQTIIIDLRKISTTLYSSSKNSFNLTT